MTPIEQTIFNDAETGQQGNCFSAYLATVLGIDIDVVPHFLHDNPDYDTWMCRVNTWLRPFNAAFVQVVLHGYQARAWGIKGLHHELRGWTRNGTCHSTVAIDGELVHDPDPHKAGLQRTDGRKGIVIPLDPSKPFGRFAKPERLLIAGMDVTAEGVTVDVFEFRLRTAGTLGI